MFIRQVHKDGLAKDWLTEKRKETAVQRIWVGSFGVS
ncbi:MAG: hypothetical protein UT18_C0014G0012 [candidate division CPR2 bacterium GW2011_GWC2_39_10]|uniref:Uncharacterized protein n=1 Tax=candidate division CPR2 bacterium GW2011_GWC2_39_10 TaxID=1618345 RepID=A0A0G0LSC8_UNCC2|nr:MAG: hypothetical protein UT18_C0014G0012 [candidate division CPR2 bacterium GW2011_GWC2_39_10]